MATQLLLLELRLLARERAAHMLLALFAAALAYEVSGLLTPWKIGGPAAARSA
jgi:hypothetical protein